MLDKPSLTVTWRALDFFNYDYDEGKILGDRKSKLITLMTKLK